MNVKELNKWEKIRERGKRSFILKYGITLFGFPFGILIAFTNNIENDGIKNTFEPTIIFGCIISGMLFGIIIGLIYGTLVWKFNEKEWLKSKIGEN